MTTAMCCSKNNKGISMYRSALHRSMPLGSFYALFLFAMFPLPYLITLAGDKFPQMRTYSTMNSLQEKLYGVSNVYSGISGMMILLLCAVFPIVIATAMFTYLHDKAATDVYHALPMTRSQLFSSHYLAGLTLLWVPLMVCFFILFVAGGMRASDLGAFYSPPALLQELFCWLVTVSAIYSLCTLVIVSVGTLLDTVLFSLVICGIAPVLMMIFRLMVESFLQGFGGEWTAPMRWSDMLSFSPFTLMIYRMTQQNPQELGTGFASPDFQFNFYAILIWMVLCVVLFFVAQGIYRRRKSELAGRVSVPCALGILVKYTATFVFAVCFGMLFSASFNERALVLPGVILGGMVAFATIEAITARGFKTFPKAFLHMGISVGLVAVFTASLLWGGFGFTERLPAEEKVESACINYVGRYGARMGTDGPQEIVLTTQEGIQIVREFHKEVLGTLKEKEIAWDESAYLEPRLRYQLKNGTTMIRYFNRNIPLTTLQSLSAVENLEEFKKQTHPAWLIEAQSVRGMTLMNRLGAGESYHDLSKAEATSLLEALRSDALAQTLADVQNNAGAPRGYVRLEVLERTSKPSQDLKLALPQECAILVTEQSKATLAWLESAGWSGEMVLDEATLTKAALVRSEYNRAAWNNSEGLYFVASPTLANRISVEEALSYRVGQNYVTADTAAIRSMLHGAQNSAKSVKDGYMVYFYTTDTDAAMPLYVPNQKVPEALKKQYEEMVKKEQAGSELP